jgi:hypothetical protein
MNINNNVNNVRWLASQKGEQVLVVDICGWMPIPLWSKYSASRAAMRPADVVQCVKGLAQIGPWLQEVYWVKLKKVHSVSFCSFI